ncbi:MASE1 domain-containing protein [Dyella sp.]|uniref:MASE1 domain-containing protein n=1 Tax=Dyella sp. TaxID=1869338 RepID=UPI002FD9C5EC
MRTIGKKDLLLAIGYALLYVAVRECSVIHADPSVIYGQLPAGMRLAALLLLPTRLWPYILAGDALGSLYYREGAIHDLGWTWFAAAMVFPPLSTLAPAAMFRFDGQLGGDISLSRLINKLLRTAGLASVLNGVTGIVTMGLITYSDKVKPLPQGNVWWASVFILGTYLGILLIVPALVTWSLSRRRRGMRIVLDLQFDFKHVQQLAVATAGILGAFLAINWLTGSREVHTIVCLLMFAPCVWITVRHGWTGAVVTTVLANLALEGSMPRATDTDLLESQVLMALVTTAMLILGASLTEHRNRSHALAGESKHFETLARKNLLWGESRVRRAASQVERAFMVLQAYTEQAADLLQVEQQPSASALLRWQGTGMVRREVREIISGMEIRPLETHGLYMALASGPIAQALHDANISYAVRMPRVTVELPHEIEVLIYRVAYDLVMLMCRDNRAYRVAMRLRVRNGAIRNVSLVVRVWAGAGNLPPLPPPNSELDQVRGLAQTYKGIFHDHRKKLRPTVGITLRGI